MRSLDLVFTSTVVIFIYNAFYPHHNIESVTTMAMKVKIRTTDRIG